MSVKIRFMRIGRTNRPFFRLAASDTRFKRDGKCIEVLGNYDPLVADRVKGFVFDEARVKYWLSVGATPSPTVHAFLKKRGFTFKVPAIHDRSGRQASRKAKAKRNAGKKTAKAAKK